MSGSHFRPVETQTEPDLSAENMNSVYKTCLSLLSVSKSSQTFGLSGVADTAARIFCTTCTFLYVPAVAHVEERHVGGKPLNHSGAPGAGREP